MKRLKSPEMPDLKVPAAVADLYFDLRERRLLPLIALVILAIVTVPFLLGSDPESVVPSPVMGDVAGDDAATTSFTVVEAKPGLRAPGKRLDARTPTNPFKQRYTSLPKEAQLESTSTSSSTPGGGSGEVIVGEEEVVEETVTPPEDDGGTGPTPRLELVIDVQITRTEKTADGGEKTGELEVRRNVPVLAQLPGKKTPVVTAMGANLQKERLIFLVSHEVEAVVGEFSCITRSGEICELLEVAPGMLLEYIYEPSGARYAIKVTDARVIRARKRGEARSSRAALGGTVPRSAFP